MTTATQQRIDWHNRAIRTPHHRDDPEPAKAAGAKAVEHTTERAAVLSAIAAWPMTHDELDYVFAAWPARNAAKRCSDLHTAARGALVKPTGETRPTRHGRQATIWTVTAEGRRIAEPWHGIHPQQLVAQAIRRNVAGIGPATTFECPFDAGQYQTRAGLIQHLRRAHHIIRGTQ